MENDFTYGSIQCNYFSNFWASKILEFMQTISKQIDMVRSIDNRGISFSK